MLSMSLRMPPPLRLLMALMIAGFVLALGAGVALAQDSTVVSPPPAEPGAGLAALALAAVSLVAFVGWQAIKRLVPAIDQLPAFPQRVAVVVISGVLTAAGTMAGIPLPTSLDALTQTDLTAILTWLATILFGGGGAMAAHAGRVAVLGRRTL